MNWYILVLTFNEIQQSLIVPSPLKPSRLVITGPTIPGFPFRTSWFDFRHKMSRVLNQVPGLWRFSVERAAGSLYSRNLENVGFHRCAHTLYTNVYDSYVYFLYVYIELYVTLKHILIILRTNAHVCFMHYIEYAYGTPEQQHF